MEKCYIVTVKNSNKLDMTQYEEIKKAKEVLEKAGYQVRNLWCVQDVQSKYNCTDEEALDVLEEALTNEASMNQIWLSLFYHAEEHKLIRNTDET